MKHHEDPNNPPVNPEPTLPSVADKISGGTTYPVADVGPGTVRELLEKNLKWSQILYEQNRRLNRKLLWLAISGWLRLFIILVPILFALLYLPPIIKKYTPAFNQMLDMVDLGAQQKAALEKFLAPTK
jgi:hypothetical protein